MNRAGQLVAALLLVALTGCRVGSSPAPSPPTIQNVGVAVDVRIYQDHMRYAFADGAVHEVPLSYRHIGDGGLSLVIIGSDSAGPFVASFPTQDGLPADCYRENAEGIERGAFIETRGVLWAKAPTFSSSEQPDLGSAYPSGSRFCFNDNGMMTTVVGP